ncbi:unnamed protein product [Plutella xylostella]|uniref:(diamondback moth) hypothetical protein n=1 Tax=Plutella xylostella TaxID=51655 RepID=A0A8S4GAB2_PLUXY|nr:unnamed protein product [Plutella xylostella]
MLYHRDGRKRVYRQPGEHFSQVCFEEKVAHVGGSFRVRAGNSAEGRTALVPIENGNLTTVRYINEVLNEHAGPFLANMGENAMFMHDNTRAHTAQVVNEYLHDVGIHKMEWPARSPGLNLIELAWDELDRTVRDRVPPPITLRGLKDALIKEWENIPQHMLRNLVFSMPNRVEAVLRARGGNTKY